MNYILFDDNTWDELLPLTYTRPVSYMRIGILTLIEKWNRLLNSECTVATRDYLQEKYPIRISADNIFINSSVIPGEKIIEYVARLEENTVVMQENTILFARIAGNHVPGFFNNDRSFLKKEISYEGEVNRLVHYCNIFSKNGEQIEADFELITRGRVSGELNSSNRIIGTGKIFVEEGAVVNAAIINTEGGPVYIGRDSEIMEGSLIRGPFALCEHSTLKMSSKIYGPTTIGPYSKVGGEVNNSVIFGYSNKAHDGFLGNSVIGEWCNLGADTNNSNLKNNYVEVKMWNYPRERFEKTGLLFAGLVMGDHSKCGINTMFNTGTVVGVSSNLYGSGFHRNFVSSFSWGGPLGYTHFNFDKAIEVAKVVMSRRNVSLDEPEIRILKSIYEMSEKNRIGYNS